MVDIAVPQEVIQNKIFLLRGAKVMLDKELATLYGVKSIRLREQVKRNIKRFPFDFMFQLNEKEVRAMVSHFAIPSRKHLGGHLPYAFTEHGILMLSSVLNSERAVEVNIQIMRTFTKLRQLMLKHADLRKKRRNGEEIRLPVQNRLQGNQKNCSLHHAQNPNRPLGFTFNIEDAIQSMLGQTDVRF